MDKVQKIREEVERLKSQLVRGACASQTAMENRCKEEAYNEVLAILDTLQEEHKLKPKFQEGNKIVYVGERKELDTDEHTILYVYDDMYVTTWGKKIPFKFQDDYQLVEESVSESMNTESMIESYKQRLISQANGMKNSPFIDMCLASYKHGINETLDTLKLSNVERIVKDWKEEPVSEDLEKAGKEWIRPQLDKCYKPYGEGKMMELTRFDGYAMLDAIEFGAMWQKQQDQSTIELAEDHAMLAGMEKMKEQMMKDAIDGWFDEELGAIVYDWRKYDFKEGDKVKIII